MPRVLRATSLVDSSAPDVRIGALFYARPNREGEPEGAGPGCGNVRFVEGGGAILYGFKIFAAIYYPFG